MLEFSTSGAARSSGAPVRTRRRCRRTGAAPGLLEAKPLPLVLPIPRPFFHPASALKPHPHGGCFGRTGAETIPAAGVELGSGLSGRRSRWGRLFQSLSIPAHFGASVGGFHPLCGCAAVTTHRARLRRGQEVRASFEGGFLDQLFLESGRRREREQLALFMERFSDHDFNSTCSYSLISFSTASNTPPGASSGPVHFSRRR